MTIKTSYDGRGNRIMKFTLKALAIATVASASTLTFAAETTTEHSFSGNIGVQSAYYLRGLTNNPENDNATVSGGLDYSHSSGFYAGWWGSTLGYSLTKPEVVGWDDEIGEPIFGYEGSKAFENDFYIGYNGSINEDLGYTLGLTYYYYYESDATVNAAETLVGLNYKDFSLTAQTLLKDVEWGNKGDTYYLASYSYALPQDFTLDANLGVYTYKKSGKFIENSEKSFAFRDVTIGLSKPLADTGVTANMSYIFGGYDRDKEKQKNKVVFGLSYGF